jgi:PTS system nitrogen regulatory IIA component
MNDLSTLIDSESVLLDASVKSKKKALQVLANHFSNQNPSIDADLLFDSLIERERLGSTGFGNGVAIPHCRISGINTPLACFMRLEKAVDYEASDQKRVDILFCLIAPTDANQTHVELLSQVASILSDNNKLKLLRSSTEVTETLKLITD